MNSTNKKKMSALAGTIGAGIIAAGTIAGVSYEKKTEIPYELHVENQYVTELKIDMPDEEHVDIVELYCNDNLVGKGLLPNDHIKSIPLVFSNLENLTIKTYNRGEQIGECEFENDKLIYKR